MSPLLDLTLAETPRSGLEYSTRNFRQDGAAPTSFVSPVTRCSAQRRRPAPWKTSSGRRPDAPLETDSAWKPLPSVSLEIAAHRLVTSWRSAPRGKAFSLLSAGRVSGVYLLRRPTMLVCAGRAAQRRARLETEDYSSSDEEDAVPFGPIARPRNRFDPRVVRSRNCVNAKKARRAAVRRKSDRVREEERRRRAEEWERKLMLARASRVMARQNAEAGALNLVSMYHKMLQRGFVAMDGGRQSVEIQDFVRSALTDDILTPEFIGLKTFMQQWDFISRLHAEVEFRADRLQLFPMEGAAKTYPSLATRDRDEAVYVVKSTGVTTLRISRLTIESIFPHILADEELVQHLIGKTYSFNFAVFSHVSADGRIFQMESRVDLSSSLMTLLQDRDAAAEMIRQAAFMSSGNLSLQDEVREAQNMLANSYL